MSIRVASRLAAVWMVLAALSCAGDASGEELRFSQPIACTIGPGCQIQNYADDDPGPEVRDHACGRLTYDGHKGTDFRIRDESTMALGVKVLAAADGVVRNMRDGMPDVSIRVAGAGSVAGRECGNGVVIAHGDGWETQYCHMKQGSITVRPGSKVARGDVLGLVGISGFAEFAHLHFEVRHGKTVIDPFTSAPVDDPGQPACGGAQASLWDDATAAAVAYRGAAFLDGAFAAAPPDLSVLEREAPPAPEPGSPALLAYVRVLGVRAGDVETLTLTDPDKAVLAAKGPTPLAAAKVQWLSFAGRKLRGERWKPGTYTALYRLERDGQPLVEETITFSMP